MKVAYILAEFPCRSETFARREIDALVDRNWDVIVLAAKAGQIDLQGRPRVSTIYRPPLLSLKSALAMAWLMLRYPLGLSRLIVLLMRMLLECPRDALVVLKNLGTTAYFARRLDAERIEHVHAYFLSWPACIGASLHCMTGRRLSLAGHARDIFVSPGAIRTKTRAAM